MNPYLVGALSTLVGLCGGAVIIMGWLYVADRRERRSQSQGHNDRDYHCRFWWGDRSGSAVGLDKERCLVCNPDGEG